MSLKDLFTRKCKEVEKEVNDAEYYLLKAEEKVKQLRECNKCDLLKEEIRHLLDNCIEKSERRGWIKSNIYSFSCESINEITEDLNLKIKELIILIDSLCEEINHGKCL